MTTTAGKTTEAERRAARRRELRVQAASHLETTCEALFREPPDYERARAFALATYETLLDVAMLTTAGRATKRSRDRARIPKP